MAPKEQIIPSAESRQQNGQYVSALARCDVSTQFPDILLPQFSRTGSIDVRLVLAGQGYGVRSARSLGTRGHEAYPCIHMLFSGKERVCWGFIATFRKDSQLQETARFLVDSMKELRQDYKGNAPVLHTRGRGHLYGQSRILNGF